MKKANIIILLSTLLLIGFTACKKDNNPPTERFIINKEKEKVTATTTSVTITGEYIYDGKVKSMFLQLGTEEHLFGSNENEAVLHDKAYSVTASDLTPGTLYYYRYFVDYGDDIDFESDIYQFTTQSEAPTVRTLEVLATDSTSVRVKCEVLSGGGLEVTERGICYNTYGDPTLDDDTLQYTSGGPGLYTIRMENLTANMRYYVRAYAKNGTGIGFGEVLEFKTGGETSKPQVSTVEVNEVTYNAATCLCNVSSDGGLELTERGVCWGLEPDPTVNVHKVTAQGTETGNYTVTIEGLNPNTDYHVRAYAINEKGIAYGEDLPFTTTDGKPTVTTAAVTNITATSATGGGTVTNEGASQVTERGICWSTSHEPTTSGSHAQNGTGAGNYTCDMTVLVPNETYYVRAYATNNQGTAYGAEVEFTAREGMPVVVTLDVTDITATSAKAHGKVTDQGGSTVTERGICWGTEPSPTISGSHASSGTGIGEYTVEMTDLVPGTKYYVRAYAINAQGMTYGGQEDFTTSTTLPTVVTGNINGTTVSGEVTSEGGATVTERGVCWSTSHQPTVDGSHGSSGSGLGTFSVELTDLAPGTTYYVRAYATNSAGTSYGSEKTLATEANLPTVTTGEVTNIGQNTAQGSGIVTDDGGANVTERGVCWSTSHNPTISGSHANSGTGTGGFTVNMTSLTANTHYYVRAYAKNSAGVSYGNEVDFTTSQSISAPTVTTSQVTNVTQTTATGGGNVTSDGGAAVTERGICWSTSHNPTTSGSHANSGTGTGSFTVNMTGLTPNTTYYVRAYAINSAGTSYGSELFFNTETEQPEAPVGAINSLFSVSAAKQVYFSQGNLQYRASTNTWRFAENQWDYVGGLWNDTPFGNVGGSSNNNISSTYSGWIDLFGWSTSGINHNNSCYQPWSTSIDEENYYAYGLADANLYDGTGEMKGKADWGYNAISNGGGQTGNWRTLKIEEWDYLLNQRNTPSTIRYVKAQVNEINGIILLPDNWNQNCYPLVFANTSSISFNENIISLTDWINTFETNGAVFLVAAGSRNGTTLFMLNSWGNYSTSSSSNWQSEESVVFNDSNVCTYSSSLKCNGLSVRLVQDYKP